jgi:hypothetical protein
MPDSRPLAVGRPADLDLGPVALEQMRARLPAVAAHTVAAIDAEVPDYAHAMSGPMGAKISEAVQVALGGFLSLASRPRGSDAGTPLAPAIEGAYALGRGEAVSGRSMDALLSAYRVGARVSWRELSATAVAAGVSADTLARFAELVFAYIDELSAASVAGHADQLRTAGGVRHRYLQRLGRGLLLAEPPDVLAAAAERADWPVPRTLTAVLLPASHVRPVLGSLPAETLHPEELPDVDDADELAVLLAPDADGSARRALLRALRGHPAVVGPGCDWTQVRRSYVRALRARALGLTGDPVDCDQRLMELTVGADRDALADLRAQALAPLAGLRPGTGERLAETLRAWLLHQGRREEVAASLHVHPQTVRYRMGQLRELYGDGLQEPATVLALTVALATWEP